ncbi:MAG: PAS domain S-box protein [Candidatus Heimdallarchaeota archaeon]
MPRILLVDDDEIFLGITKEFLAEEDPIFEVSTATSAYEALERLEIDHFDAIVCDFQMPGMDGLELLERLRQNANFIPFIIFTGRGREEVAIRALNLGADYYLRKGGDPQSQYAELTHVIRNVLSHRFVMRALQKSEERYRTLVENIPIGVYRTTLGSKGKFLMVNPAIVNMLGYDSEEELKQTDVADVYLYPEERIEYAKRLLDEASLLGVEIRLKKKDGTPIWGSITAGVVFRKNGEVNYFDGLLEDITERKQAEEALRKNEELYRTLFQKTPVGIVTCDDRGNILGVNKRALKFLGSPSEEATKEINLLEFPLLQEAGISADLRLTLETGREITAERSYTSKWGKTLILHYKLMPVKNEEGEITQVLATFDDVARLRKIEEELVESEQKYRELVENLREGVLLEDEKGNISFCNSQMVKLLGYSSDKELIGHHWSSIVSPSELDRINEQLKRRPKGISSTYEANLLTKGGRPIPMRISATPLLASSGNYRGVLSVFTDNTSRLAMEKALGESEEKYRSIVENSHEGIMITGEDFRSTYVNDQLCRLIGYSLEEMIGEDFRRFLDEESKALVTDRYIRSQRGEEVPSRYEFSIIRKSGEKRRVETSSTVLADTTGKKITIAQLLDITERKEAEMALKESEEKYRTIIEEIEDGYYEVDLAGNLSFFNEPLRKTLGYSSDELLGMNNRQYMDSETAKRIFKIYNMVYQTGTPVRSIEWENIRKDGSRAIMEGSVSLIRDSKGVSAGFRGIVRDITERKRAEEARKQVEAALQVSEERYRELVEKMREGVWAGDINGVTTFVNPQTAEMLSYTHDEMLGMHWTALVPSEEFEKIEEIDRSRVQGESSTYESVLQTKDGQRIAVIISGTPLYDAKGEFRGTMAVFTDISDLKQAEEQLMRQKDELSQFANTMNHDLQNRLHNILGYATLIRKRHKIVHAEKIEELAKNASELLRQSVALADAGLVIKKRPGINLAELVQETAKSILPEGTEFKLDPLPTVTCDRTRVIQIFQNLFENALYHGNAKKIEVRQRKEGNGIGILITNDGLPIPPEHRQNIFQRKFSTKEKGGLGLTLVQKLVKAHGWEISLESAPKTTFRIFISAESHPSSPA